MFWILFFNQINTSCDTSKIIEGSKSFIENALFSPKSQTNLLSFKDIYLNGYHIEIRDDRDMDIFVLHNIIWTQKKCNGKAVGFFPDLYFTYISINGKFIDKIG